MRVVALAASLVCFTLPAFAQESVLEDAQIIIEGVQDGDVNDEGEVVDQDGNVVIDNGDVIIADGCTRCDGPVRKILRRTFQAGRCAVYEAGRIVRYTSCKVRKILRHGTCHVRHVVAGTVYWAQGTIQNSLCRVRGVLHKVRCGLLNGGCSRW